MKVRRHVPGPGFWAAIRGSRWVTWILGLFGGGQPRRGKGDEGEWLARVNRESLARPTAVDRAGAERMETQPAASESRAVPSISTRTGHSPLPDHPSTRSGSHTPGEVVARDTDRRLVEAARHAPEAQEEKQPATATSQGPPVPVRPTSRTKPLANRLKNIQWGRGIRRGREWVQAERLKKAFMQADWRWLLGGTLIGALLVGYLLAAFVFFPAPFFNADRPIPRVIGLDTQEATAALRAAGFVPGEPRLETHPSVPRGSVSWQDPPEDVAAPAGSVVRLSVSRGPQDIPVPDVSRYEAELAKMLIVNSGLTVRRVDSIPTALPRDVAVGTRPAAGATLSPGSPVVLIVSLGAPTLSVPDLRGLTLDEAREVLTAAGLTLGRSWREFSNEQPAELIFRQEPPVGTLIAPGSPVNVVLARTP